MFCFSDLHPNRVRTDLRQQHLQTADPRKRCHLQENLLRVRKIPALSLQLHERRPKEAAVHALCMSLQCPRDGNLPADRPADGDNYSPRHLHHDAKGHRGDSPSHAHARVEADADNYR